MIRVLRAAAFGVPAGLVLAAVYTWTGSIVATLVLVALPVLAVVQARLLGDEVLPRLEIYRSSMASHVVFGALAVLAGLNEFGLDGLGLLPLPGVSELLWSLGVMAAVLGANMVLHFVTEALGMETSAFLRRLVPRSARDRKVFAVMSVTAGLGEEIVYRGFLFAVLLAAGLPVAGALIVQAVAFGMVHAYQGPVGVAATGLLGLVFGLSVVWLGTLWPAILAHVGVDWVVGLLMTDYFFGPGEEPAGEDSPEALAPREPEIPSTDSS